MANLLSELERFEQEMKELVSDSQSPPSSSTANNASMSSGFTSSSKAGTLTGVPSTTNGTGVQTIASAQQSSRPPAPPPPPVGTTGYLPLRPPSILASSTQLQTQVSDAPAQVVSSVQAAPHLQWMNSGAGPTPSAPVPPVSASTSSQFTFTNVSYPPGPSNGPSPSVTPTSGAPYFPLPFHLQQQPENLQQQQQPEQTYHQQQQYLMPQYLPQVQKQYKLAPQPARPAAIQASQYQYSYQASVSGGGMYSLPQQQQAQQLFQKDAQTITPEALESVKAALASSESEHKAETKKKAIPRKAAGQSWEDPTLADWPESIHCCFNPFCHCNKLCIIYPTVFESCSRFTLLV